MIPTLRCSPSRRRRWPRDRKRQRARKGKQPMTEQPAAKGKASAGRGSSGAMKMVVGLGNPGPQYEGTRHNVGFAVVHRLARQVSAPPARMKGPALVSEAKDAGVTIVLAQPLTFMNRSGRAVSFLLDAYGIPADDMLVVYDDVHLDRKSVV